MTDITSDQFPDKIFVKGHLTPMEKLMFANAEIAQLKKEIGGMKSEIQFLEHEIKKITPISRAENIEIRKDKVIVDMKKQNKKLISNNQKLMKTNGELIAKLYQLNRSVDK
jgi:cell division protein FtsB